MSQDRGFEQKGKDPDSNPLSLVLAEFISTAPKIVERHPFLRRELAAIIEAYHSKTRVGDTGYMKIEAFDSLAQDLAKRIGFIEYNYSEMPKANRWHRNAEALTATTAILAVDSEKTYPRAVYNSLMKACCCLNNGAGWKLWRNSPFDRLEDMWDCQKDTYQSHEKCIAMLGNAWKKFSDSQPKIAFDAKERPYAHTRISEHKELQSIFKAKKEDFTDASEVVTACNELYKLIVLNNTSKFSKDKNKGTPSP